MHLGADDNLLGGILQACVTYAALLQKARRLTQRAVGSTNWSRLDGRLGVRILEKRRVPRFAIRNEGSSSMVRSTTALHGG